MTEDQQMKMAMELSKQSEDDLFGVEEANANNFSDSNNNSNNNKQKQDEDSEGELIVLGHTRPVSPSESTKKRSLVSDDECQIVAGPTTKKMRSSPNNNNTNNNNANQPDFQFDLTSSSDILVDVESSLFDELTEPESHKSPKKEAKANHKLTLGDDLSSSMEIDACLFPEANTSMPYREEETMLPDESKEGSREFTHNLHEKDSQQVGKEKKGEDESSENSQGHNNTKMDALRNALFSADDGDEKENEKQKEEEAAGDPTKKNETVASKPELGEKKKSKAQINIDNIFLAELAKYSANDGGKVAKNYKYDCSFFCFLFFRFVYRVCYVFFFFVLHSSFVFSLLGIR
jgi:hypothetical protein